MKKSKKLKKAYKNKKIMKINKLKVFNETGKIIANPLINKDNDYFC